MTTTLSLSPKSPLLPATSPALESHLTASISNISLLSLSQQPTTQITTENHNSPDPFSRLSQQLNSQRNLKLTSPSIRRFSNSKEPDSPSLVPVSIAGSPSNFLLSNNSPPGSYKAHPGSYHRRRPVLSVPIPKDIGGRSPELAPVGTLPPMTPLILSIAPEEESEDEGVFENLE